MATKKKTTSTVAKDVLSEIVSQEATEKIDITDVTTGNVTISDYAIINVKSNVFGTLIYVNPKTGYQVEWPMCGSMQQLTFGELREMKASNLRFYLNQWIIITGFGDENAEKYKSADIYKALYITQYYKNLVEPSDYNDVCSWTPDEIKEKVSYMSQGARDSLLIALNTYVEKGLLDSLKAIKAFEEALGCELRRPE